MVSKGGGYTYLNTWGNAVPSATQGHDREVQLAQRMRFTQAGWIVGARFLHNLDDGYEHIAMVRVPPDFQMVRVALFRWKTSAAVDAVDGWQHTYFRPRLRVEVDDEVLLCVFTSGGWFYYEPFGCATDVTVGPITVPADEEFGVRNGRYRYESLQPPPETFHSNRYGIDVLFLVDPS